ncbi:hypothetical protein COCMIDRAFT_37401 [Bipolaris oryzae ATCC 44560]|uniref:Azaphilone pigments biosynthesis cluster protein L N-terminal domain-containing protein n=1 Tax=Bipolaris oryzae ATCC 44560 TaxID=930090 RepID=W6ZBF9_COCMI|nr:uncharacterized protein COCMIDRAFT_37401 [Bipolaris oryzae ATCC 44560]EUC44784.1 hypothetical protein COCMIDRAFT_37401 [Bipolaris oryzae ATCC 44560]
MADPFSVAGTAVGIISLGLQTCQILYNYCSEFKSFPRDVENIRRQIRGLEGILEGLHEVKEQLEIDNHTPSSQLHMALKECEEMLHELTRMVEKRNPASKLDGVQTQLRAMKGRILWPYRKEDLKEVQSSLTRFQENLALALQCAGLDGTLRRLRDLHSEFIVQQQQAVRVEQTLNQHTEALQMIRRDVASQGPDLSKIYNEIMILRAHLLEDGANSDSSSRKLTLTSSSTVYAFPHEGAHERTSQLSKQSGFIQTRKSNSYHCHSKRKRKVESGRWYKVLTDEVYDHHKDCPRFAHGDYTRSVAVQLSIYKNLLKFCVQIGWQYSRKGGWNSLAPVLRYRAVVPSDSPVFRILGSAIKSIVYRNTSRPIRRNMATSFVTVAPELQQEFRKGACPTDLDTNGNGILYKFMSTVPEIIDLCFDAGVPFDDQNAEGSTPVEYWLSKPLEYVYYVKEWKLLYGHVLFCLAQRAEGWSFSRLAQYKSKIPSYQIVFDNMSALLQLESFSNTFTDDFQHEVILRRSELDFATRLKAPGVDTWVSLFARFDSVYALASWPGGLSTMLSNPNVNLSQNLLKKLLYAAIVMKNIKSIEVLLNYEVPITRRTWNDITRQFFEFEGHDRQTNLSLTKIYHRIASHLYQDDNTGSDDQIKVEEIHDLERDDIELLEKVVVELEEKWAGYKKPFVTFMNRVWRPRMRKMRRERQADKATYEAELVRMGITLEEPYEKTDEETDSDSESDASWSDDYEDADSEGWYTTDEDVDEVEDCGEDHGEESD